MAGRFSKGIALWLIDNAWQVAVVIVATYTIVQYQRGLLSDTAQLIVWLMVIIELMAISGIIERNRRLGGIERKITDLQNQELITGICKVYEDRDHLPSFTDDLEAAKSEVFIVGLALISLTVTYLDTLKSKAEQDCQLRILLLCPGHDGQTSPVIQRISLNLGFDPEDYARSIESNIKRLQRMRDRLPKDKQKNLEIRAYDCVPTFVMTGLDANTRNGRIRIEFIPYKVARSLWPGIEVRHEDRSKLYSFFYESANQMWNDAHSWPP